MVGKMSSGKHNSRLRFSNYDWQAYKDVFGVILYDAEARFRKKECRKL